MAWFDVLNLRNTHRQPLPIRGCWTELETVEKEREIEMWRRAVALYPQSETNIYTAGDKYGCAGLFFLSHQLFPRFFCDCFQFFFNWDEALRIIPPVFEHFTFLANLLTCNPIIIIGVQV